MEILMGWGSYLKDHPGWGGGGYGYFLELHNIGHHFCCTLSRHMQGLMCTYVQVFSCHLNLVQNVQILHNFISAG